MGKSKTFGDNSGKEDVYNYDNHPRIITRKQHMMDKNKVFSFRNVGKKRDFFRDSEIKLQKGTFIKWHASLLNCVPYVLSLPACLACLRANVPPCLACLLAHVDTCLVCLRAHAVKCLAWLRAHVSTCIAFLRAHLSTYLVCWFANVPYVLTCQRALCAYVLTYHNFKITKKKVFSGIIFRFLVLFLYHFPLK